MATFLVAYVISFVAFACIDIAWLTLFGAQLYKSALADILAPEVRLGPAAAFYLMYPVGLVYFTVDPALKTGALGTAILNGALLGLLAYGTYELTNFATLRGWTLSITLIDMAYGAAASAVVAAIAFKLTPGLVRGLGW